MEKLGTVPATHRETRHKDFWCRGLPFLEALAAQLHVRVDLQQAFNGGQPHRGILDDRVGHQQDHAPHRASAAILRQRRGGVIELIANSAELICDRVVGPTRRERTGFGPQCVDLVQSPPFGGGKAHTLDLSGALSQPFHAETAAQGQSERCVRRRRRMVASGPVSNGRGRAGNDDGAEPRAVVQAPTSRPWQAQEPPSI